MRLPEPPVAPAEAPAELRTLPGVLGVGYGVKESDGLPTGAAAWRVYVQRKRPRRSLAAGELVPPAVAGTPTDVIEKAPTVSTGASGAALPAPGAQIANARGVPGSLACVALTDAHGEPVLLTNYHVLFGAGAGVSDSVWLVEGSQAEPTFRHAGCTLDGRLGPVVIDGVEHHVDCAVGSLDAAGGPSHRWRAITTAGRGLAAAKPGDRVHKVGGATGLTEGVVIDVAYPDVALIDGQSRTALRQILVRPGGGSARFSAEGDSGAALRGQEGGVLGLLWGANERGESVACHIAPVLACLGVNLARVRRGRGLARLLTPLLNRGGR